MLSFKVRYARESGCSRLFLKRHVMCAAPVLICLHHKLLIAKFLSLSIQ